MTQMEWDNHVDGVAMFDLLGQMDGPPENWRDLMVRASCECAHRSLVHLPANENRPNQAIINALNFVNGNCTKKQLQDAIGEARQAIAVEPTHAASEAAQAASDAASLALNPNFSLAAMVIRETVSAAMIYEGEIAGKAAAKAVDGSGAAYVNASDRAKEVAKRDELRECAKIVRKYFPKAPI